MTFEQYNLVNVITFAPLGLSGLRFFKCNYISPNLISFGANVITTNLSGFTAWRCLLSECTKVQLDALFAKARVHGSLAGFVKLRVAHAPGIPGTFSPPVSDPGMHHGTSLTHVPWCMSGSLTRAGGENVPGIPGACTTRNFAYLARGPLWQQGTMLNLWGTGSRASLELRVTTWRNDGSGTPNGSRFERHIRLLIGTYWLSRGQMSCF